MTDREAFEAWATEYFGEGVCYPEACFDAWKAAQAAAEPVTCQHCGKDSGEVMWHCNNCGKDQSYTTPPAHMEASAEVDALRAEIAALRDQKPCATVSPYEVNTIFWEAGFEHVGLNSALYAAPGAKP